MKLPTLVRRIPGAPLTAASLSVPALAAALTLSACGKEPPKAPKPAAAKAEAKAGSAAATAAPGGAEAKAAAAAGEAKAAAGEGKAAAAPAAAAPAADAPTAGAQGEARSALTLYDEARKALAADDLPGAKAAADKLSKLTAPPAAPLAAAAKALAGAADIAAARLAFGTLSKAAISLAKADTTAGKGALAWQCPMAKGYQKWLQLEPDMANPYMGKKMLKCGGRTPLEP